MRYSTFSVIVSVDFILKQNSNVINIFVYILITCFLPALNMTILYYANAKFIKQ